MTAISRLWRWLDESTWRVRHPVMSAMVEQPPAGPRFHRLRKLRGWLCFQAVLILPIRLDSRVYCWLLAWGGWYAHGGDEE